MPSERTSGSVPGKSGGGTAGSSGRPSRVPRRHARARGGGLSPAGLLVAVTAVIVAGVGGYWLYSGGMIAGTGPRNNREYLVKYLKFEDWNIAEGLATHTLEQVRKKYDELPIEKVTDEDIKRLHEKTWLLIEIQDKYRIPSIEFGKETPELIKSRQEAAEARRKVEEPVKNEVKILRERVLSRYGVIQVDRTK
jgi:hypothetical protein